MPARDPRTLLAGRGAAAVRSVAALAVPGVALGAGTVEALDKAAAAEAAFAAAVPRITSAARANAAGASGSAIDALAGAWSGSPAEADGVAPADGGAGDGPCGAAGGPPA